MKTHSGFTLIELMITLVLVAILATIGVPSFVNFIANNRLTVQANELVSALNLARSESIKRNLRVTVCRSANGTGCGGTWNNGWIVFVDEGTAATVDGGDEVLRVYSSAGSSATLTAVVPSTTTAVNAVQFQGIGLTTRVEFTLTDANCSGDQRRIIDVGASGRISTTRASCS